VLAHPAYGQHYFWRIVIGLGMVLTVTSAARLVPPASDTRKIRPDLLVLGIGGLVTGVGLLRTELVDATSVGARLLPYAVAMAVLLLLLTVSRLRHGRLGTRVGRGLPVLVVATCFCITAAVPTAVGRFGRSVGSALVGTPSGGPSSRLVTGAEQRAALWLKAHSAPADVVATNVFCAPQAYHRGCRHVSFWVSALTGRQLLLGSWAYTEKSLSAYAHEDNNYQLGPSPWPERLAASLAAVRSPTPAAISRLQQYGVDWIFADRHATRVSPALGRYARLSYANSAVSVYRLDRPHLRR
jgi:hypothetical protein